MKVNLKRNKDCKVEMTIEVDPDRAESRFREVIRGFQKEASLPGFRQGKAPEEMVERRYAEQAREEVLKSLIPEIYHQSVQAQKVSPVSLPKISDVRYQRGQKLIFHAEFEEMPPVQVKHYKGISLKRESVEVTPEEMEREIQSLLESRAVFDPVEESRAVEKGDFITADVELWQENKYVTGRSGILLAVEPSPEDDSFEKIVGANVGDTREISRLDKPYTRVRVTGLRKKRVPGMSDAFAKELGQENEAAMRDALKKEIAAHKHTQSFEKMKQELFQKLLKNSSFPLPPSLVERQKERLIEQAKRRHFQMGATEEDWKSELPGIEKDVTGRAEEQVKLYFILQKVTEIEKIDLDEAELAARLKALAEQSGRPLEEVQRVFEDDLRDNLREKKTVDFLIAHAKFDESK